MCTCNLSNSCVTHKIIAGTVLLLHNLLCTPPRLACEIFMLLHPCDFECQQSGKNRITRINSSGTVDSRHLSICTSILYVSHIIIFIKVEVAEVAFSAYSECKCASQTEIFCRWWLCTESSLQMVLQNFT